VMVKTETRALFTLYSTSTAFARIVMNIAAVGMGTSSSQE
jgi:hypothetical protein